ncbi:MAG: ABC transporter ATP-binding protein, partial [Candidatus Izemoplasma sp.]
MSRGDIILRLVDVTRIYETKEGRKVVALDKVTTSFKRGEFVAIVGKSGSGKSTLINILGGLDMPNSGDYFLEGNNIVNINEGHWDAIRNEKIGFIFQEYHLIEYLSVYKNVEIALKYQSSLNKKVKDAKIKDILSKVGILEHMHKHPSQLSGGQRQRVAIARALVKDPAIILADEP